MEAILAAITQVGFPIVCVLGMAWFVFKLQEESVAREEKLMAIIQTYGEKLQGITITLEKLCSEVSELKTKD